MNQDRQERQILNDKHYQDFKSWCKVEGREVDRYALSLRNIIEGEIPEELAGAWVRNGPGKFRVGRQDIAPLDADGLVYKVEFSKGSVFVASKFVKTIGYTQERKDERVYFRGAFGTPKHRKNRTFVEKIFGTGVGVPMLKNTANTSVLPFGDNNTLLALWEGGLPYLLDGKTLETVETEAKLNGCLKKGDMFSAHPKIDAFTGNLYNAGPNFEENMRKAPFKNYIKIWEISPRFDLKSLLKLELERPFAVMHELGVTENYVVVPQIPVGMSVSKVFWGGDLKASWSVLQKPLLFYLVPKKQNRNFAYADKLVFEAPRGFCFHFVNCFEANEQVVVDVVLYEEFPDLTGILSTEFGKVGSTEDEKRTVKSTLGKFARYTLDLRSISKRATPKFLYGEFGCLKGVEFPCINSAFEGKDYDYAYFVSLGRPSLQEKHTQLRSLVKVHTKSKQVDRWSPKDESLLLNEPVFVESESSISEDEGFLLFSAFHGVISQTSSFFVLNAQSLDVVCHFRLDVPVPVGVHTSWQEEVEENRLVSRL